MEQILAFVLGVGVALLVWGVVVAFKTAKRVKQVDNIIQDIYSVIERNDELVNRRMDQEIDRVNQIANDCIRHTDSRVDRLESKILSVDKDGCKPAKKLIKG